jgi:hypothetical protein
VLRGGVFAEAWSAKVNESCGSIANGRSDTGTAVRDEHADLRE